MKARYGALFAIVMALAVVAVLFAAPVSAEGETHQVTVAPTTELEDRIGCAGSPYTVLHDGTLNATITAKGDYYFLGGSTLEYSVGTDERELSIENNTKTVQITVENIIDDTNVTITSAQMSDKCIIHSDVSTGLACTADKPVDTTTFGSDYDATFTVNAGNRFTVGSTVTYEYTVAGSSPVSDSHVIGAGETEIFTITLTDVQGDITLEITNVVTEPISYTVSFNITSGLNITTEHATYTSHYNESVNIKFLAAYGYYFTKGSTVVITQVEEGDLSYFVPLDGENFYIQTLPITADITINVTAANTESFIAKDTDNGHSALFYDELGTSAADATKITSGYLFLQNNATGYIEMTSYYTDKSGYFTTILVQADGTYIKFYDAPFIVHVVDGQADSITSVAVSGCAGTVIFADSGSIYSTYYTNRTANDLVYTYSSGWSLTSPATDYIGYIKNIGDPNFVHYDILGSLPSGDYFGTLYLCSNAAGSMTVNSYSNICQNSVLYTDVGVSFKTLGLDSGTNVTLTVSGGYITQATVPSNGSVSSDGKRFINNASSDRSFGFSAGLIDSGYVCSVLRAFDGATYCYADEGAVIGDSSVIKNGDEVTFNVSFNSTGTIIADVMLYSAGSSNGVCGKMKTIIVTVSNGKITQVVLAEDSQSFVTHNNMVAAVNRDGSTVDITMNADGDEISSVTVGGSSAFTALPVGGTSTTGTFTVTNDSDAQVQLLNTGNKVVYQKVVGDTVTLTRGTTITICSADYAIENAQSGDNIQIFGNVSTSGDRDAIMGDGSSGTAKWSFLHLLSAGVKINGVVIDSTNNRYVHITDGDFYVVKYFGYENNTQYARWIYYDIINGETANMIYERSGSGGHFYYYEKYFCTGYNSEKGTWTYERRNNAQTKEMIREAKVLELHNLAGFASNNSFDYRNTSTGEKRGMNLEKVVLDGIDTIPYRTFYGAPCLESLSFNGRYIGSDVCAYCYELKEAYTPELTRIDSYAFYYCTSLKEIHADGTNKAGATNWYVDSNAFYQCTSLESASFKVALTISGSAFAYCSALREVDIPDVTTVGGSAFYACSSLLSVNMPSVKSIGGSAFYRCHSLGDLYLPNVTSIDSNAFSAPWSGYDYNRIYNDECPVFRYVYMPNVTYIGESAFAGCLYLESVVVTNLDDIRSYAFHTCRSLTSFEAPNITKSNVNSIFIFCTSLTTFKANTLTDIAYDCFWGCTALKTVDIQSVTTIGSSAFRYCKSLEYLYLPNVITISDYAFTGDILNSGVTLMVNNGCTSLRSLYAPNVNTIGYCTFAGCANLEDVEITGLTTASQYCFHSAGLKKLSAPNLTAASSYMFVRCPNLKTVDLSSLGSLAEYNFYDCTSLETADLSSAITIGTAPFYNCTSLKSVKIDKCLTIGESAFFNCTGLLTLSAPKATSIIKYAFKQCTSLTNADLPYVSTIQDEAFRTCSSLETVYMPRVTALYGSCFAYSGLKSVTFGNDSSCYPDGASIIFRSSAFSNCTNLTNVSLGGAKDVIIDTYNGGSPWQSQFQACDKLTNVKIYTITDVSYYMFYQCSLLNTVTIDNADRIWYGSFSASGVKTLNIGNVSDYVGRSDYSGYSLGCSQINTLNITGEVNRICWTAFQSCTTLSKVVIKEKVGCIEYRAFYGCSALKTFTAEKDVGYLGNDLFAECKSLTTVMFASADYIGDQVFYNCQNLIRVNSDEDGLINIINTKLLDTSRECFYNCKGITKVVFGETSDVIPNYCFHSCSSLAEIQGVNITTVGIGAVYSCSSLYKINLNDHDVPVIFNTYDNHAFWHSATTVKFAGFVVTSTAGRNKYLNMTECTVLTYNEAHNSTMAMSGGSGGSSNDSGFTHVIIHENVTIGAYAFSGAGLLVDLTIGTDLDLNKRAFYNCTSLINVYGGEHIMKIDDETFEFCWKLENIYESDDAPNAYYTLANKAEKGLDRVISIPNCKTIGDHGIYLNYSVGSVSSYYTNTTYGGRVIELYAPKVTKIGENAMMSMKLTTVTLGALTELHDNSFGQRMNATTDKKFYPSIALNTFICQSYIDKDHSETAVQKLSTGMFMPTDCVRDVHLTTIGVLGTMNIATDYFTGDAYLTTLILGSPTVGAEGFKGCPIETLTITGNAVLGNNVFENCEYLYEVTINGSPSFGEFAFKNCISLESFIATDTSEPVLAADLFNGCTGLSTFYVLNLPSVPDRLFAGCAGINKINSNIVGYAIMNNVTTVGVTPFTGITLTHVEMDAIEEVDSNVFSGMTQITYLSLKSAADISDDALSSLTKISYLDIRSLKTISKEIVNNVDANNKVLQTIHIEGATVISPSAFEGCSKLKYVYLNLDEVIGNTGTITVNNNAFKNCTALTDIDLKNAAFVYDYAFYGTKITSANMPYVSKIGTYTFYNCTQLKTVTSDKCSRFGDYCFSCSYAVDGTTSGLEKIWLKSNSTVLSPYMFQNCINLKYVNSDEKGTVNLSTVTLIGDAAFSGCQYITAVIMPSEMNEIGNYAFDGCSRLVSVTTGGGGSGLTIGDYSFRNCTKLSTLSFSTVTEMGAYAFQNCKALSIIDMPMLTTMGGNAFEGCSGLTSITMDKLTAIPANSFKSCTALTVVSMNSLKNVGQYAFYDCYNISVFGGNAGVLTLGSVKTVQDYAFYNCNKFTSIDFGVYVTTIGNYSFYNMPSVTQLIFPNSLTSIGYFAFNAVDGEGNYNIVSIPSSVSSIGNNAFSTMATLSIYLNGDISKMYIGANAFDSNANVKVYLWNEFAVTDISGYVSGAKVEKVLENHTKVFLSSTLKDTEVSYNSVIAMNDGYLILPYGEYSSGTHATLYFGLSSDPNGGFDKSLALYKTAGSYDDNNIAKSGDAFRPVVSFTTSNDLSTYYVGNESCDTIGKSVIVDAKMSDGITVATIIFDRGEYHYRDTITLPSFYDPNYDLSTIYGDNAIMDITDTKKVYYNVEEGLTPSTMVLGYMETYFVMTVKKFEATVNWNVEGVIWKTTQIYYGEPVGTLPEPPTKSGYHYVCWSTVPGQEKYRISETDIIQKSSNTFYAVYSPNNYTVKVTTDSVTGIPETLEFPMKGVFSFTINPLDSYGFPIDGLITYTDLEHPTTTEMFDANTWKTGYDFYQYGFSGTSITTRTVTYNDDMQDGDVFEITLVLVEHEYSIILQFCYQPSPGVYTELAYSQIRIDPFTSSDNKSKYYVNEKVISPEVSYGEVTGIPYSKLVDKITVSTPLYESDETHTKRYTYSSSTNMTTGKALNTYDSGSMYVNYESFKDTGGVYQDEITIRYVFEEGMYNIKYVYKDDTDSVYINPTTVRGLEGSVFISGIKDKVKTGYTFVNWVLLDKDGQPTEKYYVPNQSMPLSQDILDCADNSNTISLQAVWDPNTVTVKYDLGEYKAVTVPSTTARTDETFTLPSESTFAFNRSGYVMSGWTLVDGGTDILAELNLNQNVYGTYVENGELTLYAHWSVKTYTFEVQHMDDDHPTAPGINRYTTSYRYVYLTDVITLWSADTIDSNEQFKTLTNWTCSAKDDEGTVYTVTFKLGVNSMSETIWQTIARIAKLTGSDTLKFEQVWDVKTFLLYFDTSGGGYLSPNTIGPLAVGNKFDVLSGKDLGKHGYSFQGWYCGTDNVNVYTENLDPASGEKYQLTETMAAMAVDGILTFTAVWIQSSYSIEYDLGGGVATGILPRTAYYDTQLEISYPTRSGYAFKGWTATGITSSAQYKNGDKWSSWDGSAVFSTSFCYLTWETSAVTMTAQWEQSIYMIVYLTNGGTGVPSGGTTSARVGDPFTLATMHNPEKTGYEYKGWSYDKINIYTDSSHVFTQELASAADGNNVLYMYAYWSPITYEIKYNYNGINTDDESSYIKITARYDEEVKLEHLERTGYTFKGWIGSNVDTTAKYRATAEGENWVSWTNPSEAVNASFFKNLKYAAGGTAAKLVAVYTPITYHVVYDSNGGTGEAPKDAGVYKVGDKLTLASYEPLVGTNGDKSVIGWNTDRNATTASSITVFNETIALEADASNTVTFYAVWVENGCTIKVDLGDATPSYVPSGWKQQEDTKYYVKQVQYGSSVKEAMSDWDGVTISKEGYIFASWSYSANTAISDVMVTCNFEKVENTLLYVLIGAFAAAIILIVIISRIEK